MTLKARITEDMKSAMKAKEAGRLAAIRLLLAAIKQKEVDERVELDDAAVAAVIEKLVKQRKDSVTQYEAANRQDLADIEGCVTTGDEGALNTALHKMKGAAKMVGATPLVEVIDRWQEAPGHPLAAALRQCVEEVCRQLGERA